jgi:hypothetical protein
VDINARLYMKGHLYKPIVTFFGDVMAIRSEPVEFMMMMTLTLKNCSTGCFQYFQKISEFFNGSIFGSRGREELHY